MTEDPEDLVDLDVSDVGVRELALRALPLPYSLALRLRAGGVSADAICEYVGVDEAALAGFYRMAEAKLNSELTRLAPRPLRPVSSVHDELE